jgi:hypothetical protein
MNIGKADLVGHGAGIQNSVGTEAQLTINERIGYSLSDLVFNLDCTRVYFMVMWEA